MVFALGLKAMIAGAMTRLQRRIPEKEKGKFIHLLAQ